MRPGCWVDKEKSGSRGMLEHASADGGEMGTVLTCGKLLKRVIPEPRARKRNAEV